MAKIAINWYIQWGENQNGAHKSRDILILHLAPQTEQEAGTLSTIL